VPHLLGRHDRDVRTRADDRRDAQRHQVGVVRLGRQLALHAEQVLVLEHQHRVVVADG